MAKDYPMTKAVTFLVTCALTTLPLPPAAAEYGSAAPRAVLTATALAETKSQTGRVIYSTWDGEDFDRSRPPIRWPRALEISSESKFFVELATQKAPIAAEVRAWEHLRSNGKPRGKLEASECMNPATSGTAEGCRLIPIITTSGIHWQIHFDLERSIGLYYLAVSVTWDDAQVAWINHLELND